MAVNYKMIKVQAALRLAQIVGTDQATLEAAYIGAWATALDGAEIPLSAFKDQIMMIAKEIYHIIGSDAAHPYRSFIYGRSEDLATLASTPTEDEFGSEFIGRFDTVTDSADFTPLTMQPTQTLADYSDAFFDDAALYNYSIVGNRIRHTRPLVYFEGCVFDEVTESAAYDADGDSPLPTMVGNTWVNGVTASSVQVGWTDAANAAATDSALYQQGIQLLRIGAEINLPLASQVNQSAG